MRRRTRVMLRGFIIFAWLVIVLTSGEIVARLYIAAHANYPPIPAEAVPEITRLSEHLTSDGFWIYDDFHGSYYNIENGARRTVGQPEKYSRTVWMFGNSSLFDPYAPDAFTMTSQLQTLLNRAGYRWRVVNLAVSGMLVSGEFGRLRHTEVQSGDIVVFIDGSIDESMALNCDWSGAALLTLACGEVNKLPLWNLDKAVTEYVHTLALVQHYTAQHGLRFYHFLQPSIGITAFDTRVISRETPYIAVPVELFVSPPHLNPTGESLVANVVYDALTLV